ncbi:MAG: hypothetical protein ACT4QF_14435 [Sporichthyaceae bacterium]
MTPLLLRQRFGDHLHLDQVAARSAELPDEERLDLIASATEVGDLIG